MLPVLFKIGTFEVRSYGVMMVVAFVAAIAIAQYRAKRYDFTKNQVGDLAFWCILAGVLGARVVFIAQEWGSYYSHHLNEVWSLKFEGLTSFGGLLFGMAAAILWALKHKISFWAMLDLIAPAFVIGHAIGRIGCLLNGCCFGGVCPDTFPLGVHVEGSSLLHYPVQILDTFMNLAVLGYLLYRENRGLRFGQLAGLGLSLHGLTRVLYEFGRAGTQQQVDQNIASSTYWVIGKTQLPFTQAQAMAAVLVIAGAGMYYFCRRNAVVPPPEPEAKAEA